MLPNQRARRRENLVLDNRAYPVFIYRMQLRYIPTAPCIDNWELSSTASLYLLATEQL